MNAASLINQTSGEWEYYSPPEVVEAARRTMGGIDLDPASSVAANARVLAGVIFDEDDDGLKWDWHGRVFMNHPFHKGWTACTADCKRKTCLKVDEKTGEPRGHIYRDIYSNADWIQKLIAEIIAGRTEQACNLTYAATSEVWFTPLLRRPQCFLTPRLNYLLPDGSVMKGVTKGSVVTYFGPNVDAFAREFESLGVVKVPYK